MRLIRNGAALLCIVALLCLPVMAADGGTTFEIEVNPKVILDILVVDEADVPLNGVLINLVDPDHPEVPPINGSDGRYITDGTGKISIRLFRSDTQNYKIVVNHTGYERYESERFHITASTSKTVKLKQISTPGGGGDVYYYVYYHAGPGGSVGLEKEQVIAGGTPKRVPSPSPDKGYRFDGWFLNGKRVADPSSLKIWNRTDLYARFQREPEITPSPVPETPPPITPAPSVGPSGSPAPSVKPTDRPTPPPEYTPQPSGRPAVVPGQVNDGGNGGAPPSPIPTGGLPSSGQTQPTPPSGAGAVLPTAEPHVSNQEQEGEEEICWLHWLILLCAAVTAILSTFRLWRITRRLKELEWAQKEKAAEQDEEALIR